MDFKELARKIVDDVSGIKTKDKQIDISNQFEIAMNEEKKIKEDNFELILEDLDLELATNPASYPNNNITLSVDGTVENSFMYLGKLNETPNPMEYRDGTLYKNTRNNVVYIKQGNLWETLVEDGKQGAQGPQGFAGGSGAGVKEVQSLIDTAIASMTAQILSAGITGNFIPANISGVPVTSGTTISAGVSQRVLLPAGYPTVRLTFRDYGPFTYKFGDSSVVATANDAPGNVYNQVIVQVTGTHIAFYGIGGGSVSIECGYNSSRTNFIPLYTSGTPKVSTLTVSASISQRIAIPTDSTAIRLNFRGFGPFAYRQGDVSVTALATDAPGDVFNQVVVPVVGQYLAVYGIGSGSVVIEGGVTG